MKLVQVEKWYVRNLNEENTLQNISFAFTNVGADGDVLPDFLSCRPSNEDKGKFVHVLFFFKLSTTP
jgi:hypothetical protein